MARLISLLILLLAAATPAVAKDKGQTADTRAAYEQHPDGRGIFSSAERNLIRSWLLEHDRQAVAKQPATTGLPPGLQNKAERGKPLPPGWQQKLARGEYLDREYYGYGRMLPDDLLRRLPPPPPGSEILRIEDQIIRLDAATRVILDVFGLGGH